MRLKHILLSAVTAMCAVTLSAQEIDWSANIALHQPVEGRFTSLNSNKFAYDYLVDGDNTTRMSDSEVANDIENWVIIDLGEAKEFSNVGIRAGHEDVNRYSKLITVYVYNGTSEFDMKAFAKANRNEDKTVKENNVFTATNGFAQVAQYKKEGGNALEDTNLGHFDNIELSTPATARYVAVYFGDVAWGTNVAEVLITNVHLEDPVLTTMTVTPSVQLFYEGVDNATLDLRGTDQYNRPMELTGITYRLEGMRRYDDGSLSMLDGYNRGSVTVTCGDLSQTVSFARAHADRYLFGNAEMNAVIAAGVTNSVYSEGNPANMFNVTPTDPATHGNNIYQMLPGTPAGVADVSVVIPFPTRANIDALSIIWSGGYPADYTVSVAGEDEIYTQVAEYKNHASIAGGGSAADMFYARHANVKYIKISVTRLATGYGLELRNVKAYGSWELGDRKPASIVLTPEKESIHLDETVKVVALVKDQFNERIENPEIEFETNNGTITADGVLTPAGTGEAVVTATVTGADGETLTATASVFVTAAPVASDIRVNASATVFTGDVTSATIAPVVVDQYGDAVPEASDITITPGDGVTIADDGTITLAEGAASGFITIKAGDIEKVVRFASLDMDKYLFDTEKIDKDIKKHTYEHISWTGTSTSAASTLVDGNKEIDPEAEGSRGQNFVMSPESQDFNVQAEVTIPFYDPADLDVIALTWEGAYAADYTVSVTSDYDTWTEIASVVGRDPIPATKYATDLFAVAMSGVRAMKISATRAGSGYGIKLADAKAYGTYQPVVPGTLELDPYVLVQYHDKHYSHPTTVAFHAVEGDEDKNITAYDAEVVYLRPVLLDADHNAPMVPHSDYLVSVTYSGHAEPAPEESYTLNLEDMSIAFHKPGTYSVELTYHEGEKTVRGSREIVTVHHNKMVTNQNAWVHIYDENHNELNAENCPKNGTNMKPSILMEGRTIDDGGVAGSLMVGGYDIFVDFGKVLEIPAVEVYWEGACAVGYNVIFGQTIDEMKSRYANKQYHWTLNTTRRAEVDRPRLDRIAVNVTENAAANAIDAQASHQVDITSPRAIRYVLLTNIQADPDQVWTTDATHKWDAKLAEITPYYDPEVMDEDDLINTGIESVVVGGQDGPVEYFNLQGVRVSNPAPGTIVIRRQGTTFDKIIVR